jgi:hypothetical protein
VDLFDFDVRTARTLRAMPAPFRAELLRMLELPQEERAAAIGEFHRSGIAPNLAELLIDLEEVAGVRAMVRAELLSRKRPPVRNGPSCRAATRRLETLLD